MSKTRSSTTKFTLSAASDSAKLQEINELLAALYTVRENLTTHFHLETKLSTDKLTSTLLAATAGVATIGAVVKTAKVIPSSSPATKGFWAGTASVGVIFSLFAIHNAKKKIANRREQWLSSLCPIDRKQVKDASVFLGCYEPASLQQFERMVKRLEGMQQKMSQEVVVDRQKILAGQSASPALNLGLLFSTLDQDEAKSKRVAHPKLRS